MIGYRELSDLHLFLRAELKNLRISAIVAYKPEGLDTEKNLSEGQRNWLIIHFYDKHWYSAIPFNTLLYNVCRLST